MSRNCNILEQLLHETFTDCLLQVGKRSRQGKEPLKEIQ